MRAATACMVGHMSRQALGNAAAGILFLIVAIVDFTRDSSGIGVVFVVFAAVFWDWRVGAQVGFGEVAASTLIGNARAR